MFHSTDGAACRANDTTWRGCLGALRQEASAKGYVSQSNLKALIDGLKASNADVKEHELVEDLSFLVQQLLGPHVSLGVSAGGGASKDGVAARVALCRLLVSLSTVRGVRLHGSAANLILGALRQWADSPSDIATATPAASPRPNVSQAAPGQPGAAMSGSAPSTGTWAQEAAPAAGSGLPLEALAALAALLPGHLCLLTEHERAAQLAALFSLVTPPAQQQQQHRGQDMPRARIADVLDCQNLALTTLASCCGRTGPGAGSGAAAPSAGAGGSGTSNGAASGGGTGAGALTADEAGALLAAAVALLQSCACRSRPVEDAAHSRMYAALVRALQTAVGEVKQAWVSRAALLVEGLQRFFTYGVQASLHGSGSSATQAPAAAAAAASSAGSLPPAAQGGTTSAGAGAAAGSAGGGRYRPPHLRRRECQADGAVSGLSDSDMSDTEHPAAGGGSSAGAGGAAVDRFRSSRVRLGVLTCVQAMAKSDARAMHSHWTALLPLHAPLQPRPLTPHLLTVLLFDPLTKVRAVAASTIATLVDGPAPRAILAVAEAKSMSARPPVRGFLTLSLSLGQLLLAAHAGLLHAVAGEGSTVVLPGVLRALVVLMAATPYERLPPELLPEVLKVLRTRWAVLSGNSSAVAAAGELAPIQSAYLACLAECFATKQPIPGLAAYLRQHGKQHQNLGASTGAACDAVSGLAADTAAGSQAATELVRELLAVGSNPAAAAVLRIEALAALKGLAAHYAFVFSPDAWDDLRAAAELGLNSTPSSPRGSRPPSRTPSSSSLSGAGGAPGSRALTPHAGRGAPLPPPDGGAGGTAGAAPGTSPEDKAAQLSVKLISEYLASVARQHGIARPDPAAGGAGEDDGAPPQATRTSPRSVPLGATAPRHPVSHSQVCVSPAGAAGPEEDPAAVVQRLAGMWQDATALLVPAATCHVSYMVRSAGLACLGEIPEQVFAALTPQLQQRLLGLLCEAAAADTVPAGRAAACKALGTTATFSAVLAHGELSDSVTRSLLDCLRDSVLSVRIAAGWAVANLCDAYRKRLGDASARNGGDSDPQNPEPHKEARLLQQRIQSHQRASTASAATGEPGGGGSFGPTPLQPSPPPLEPHQYRQLAALCCAAVLATQDADKVRANGIRAVGNLLSFLVPGMAHGLEAGGPPGGSANGADRGIGRASAAQGSWTQGRRQGEATGSPNGGSWRGGRPAGTGSWRSGSGTADRAPASIGGNRGPAASAGGGSSGDTCAIQLDSWLDNALTCLQSSLTTGGMKVQWNACYAALGLLRNAELLAHPRVAVRMAPLLLLLVMLVRESANFKIRTHAAAALAALPTREAYGDVLPDALLVVAGTLEGLSGGAPTTAGAASAGGKPGPGTAGTEQAAEGGDVEGGEGRFPNYRYTAGLSAQLRATLLHLLALAQPADARRVRDALARRAEFLHSCLREQLADAVRPLRALPSAQSGSPGAAHAAGPLPAAVGGGMGCRGNTAAAGAEGSGGAGAAGTERSGGGVAVQLPQDPFGLSVAGRGASPRDASSPGGLAGLLAGVALSDRGLARDPLDASRGGGAAASGLHATGGPSGLWRHGVVSDSTAVVSRGDAQGLKEADGLALYMPSCGAGEVEILEEEVEAARQAEARVLALAAPLRGFVALMTEVGPPGEAVLQDVQAALAVIGSVLDRSSY